MRLQETSKDFMRLHETPKDFERLQKTLSDFKGLHKISETSSDFKHVVLVVSPLGHIDKMLPNGNIRPERVKKLDLMIIFTAKMSMLFAKNHLIENQIGVKKIIEILINQRFTHS